MKRRTHTALNVVTTIVVTLGITRALGSIPFAPSATKALIDFAAWFGAYGDERIEDIYAILSLSVAFLIAAAFVLAVNLFVRRRA